MLPPSHDNRELLDCACPQYEAYIPMADREIRVIIEKARQRWKLRHVAVAHRVGIVPTAESSVEIAISSTHRAEALAAVQYAIDELKAKARALPSLSVLAVPWSVSTHASAVRVCLMCLSSFACVLGLSRCPSGRRRFTTAPHPNGRRTRRVPRPLLGR